jgi:nitroimidazol reductase NimA-like FMN-containing flavoprotein (pyridoxamine 5'-phosphate oxidase superfamily)
MNLHLSETDMVELLQKQLYGHLGCTLPNGEVYVVPITFAYQDDAVYSFSFKGQKIEAMRKNPSVCFQVEDFLTEGIWKSVVAWGTYEELSSQKEIDAAKILFKKLEKEHGTAMSPLYTLRTEDLFKAASRIMQDPEAIFYCIRIQKKTGKYIQNN